MDSSFEGLVCQRFLRLFRFAAAGKAADRTGVSEASQNEQGRNLERFRPFASRPADRYFRFAGCGQSTSTMSISVTVQLKRSLAHWLSMRRMREVSVVSASTALKNCVMV